MASLKERINDLTGFDSTDDAALASYLGDGVREVINLLPRDLKYKCSQVTNLYIGNTNTTESLDGKGEILQVTRRNGSGGYFIPARQVDPRYGDLTNNTSSLMHKASSTDPIYWIESNSSDAATLFVRPTVDADNPAKIIHVSYPTFVISGGQEYDITAQSSILNFPDEVEHIVVLYAAVKVAERQLAVEEDVELYGPLINTLKQSYIQGLQSIGVGVNQQQGA